MGINNLSKSIAGNEIETIIKGLPTKTIPRIDEFIAEFETFKTELLNLLNKTEKEGTLQNSFYEPSSTVIPNPEKIQPQRNNEIRDQSPL